jgi:hypothetical protein
MEGKLNQYYLEILIFKFFFYFGGLHPVASVTMTCFGNTVL